METSELLKKVRKIEIKTKGLTNQMFSGEYQSAFKGRGMSFSEVREYGYGDEIRSIDWNVTARNNAPYVKVFNEERELTMMLLIDVSASVFYGTQQQTKNEFITELAAVLAFSAIKNNDKVGLILFSDKINTFIPPKKGKSHILRIIRELVTTEASSAKTDMLMAMQFFNNIMKKRAITFLISDFLHEPNYKLPLSLAARKHDLVGMKVFDKNETNLPTIGLIRAIDEETGTIKWIDTSDKNTRKQFKDYYETMDTNTQQLFKKAGTDFIQFETSQGYIKTLMLFFKKRTNSK